MTEQPVLATADTTTAPHVAMVVEQMWQPVPGGSGTYIAELASALRNEQVRVAGLAAHHRRGEPDPGAVGLGKLPVRQSVLPRTLLYEAWNRLPGPRAESVVPGAEVVHATTWAIPRTRLPLAVTVHDVAFRRSPEHFTRRGARYFERSLARTRAEADAVITPSRATADDCVRAGIETSRITVIPHGVRTRTVADGDVTALRTSLALTRDYVLWTGTREPRKNLPALLRAFTLLAADHPDLDLDLVLVGPAGWGDDSAETSLVADLGERVHVVGRLDDADLAAAYAGARAFAFPSTWEGFGLPVLEAMAYGAPVVTSRGTSREEVCVDAALLAEPQDPGEIAARLADAVGPAHDSLSQAGRERAATFTWEACAAAHAEVYAGLVRA